MRTTEDPMSAIRIAPPRLLDAPETNPHLQAALRWLLEADDLARELSSSPWDLALEIGHFHAAGCTSALLRWLVCHGYVDHASEVAGAKQPTRRFRREAPLQLTDKTCLVLTEAGRSFA